MRVIVIGDIHGCLTSLRTLERTVPLRQGETLVTLGDYVDRGPRSREVLDWLIEYREGGGQLIPLLGNHELMMLQARKGMLARNRWLASGGFATLRSYTGMVAEEGDPDPSSGKKRERPKLDLVPEGHWKFLESCRPYFETDRHIFVHAGLEPDVPLNEQPEESLFWKRFNDPDAHVSGKHFVCGHTPQRNGEPRALAHATCIDTLVYQGGWLTALEVESGRCWQANEEGQARMGVLELDIEPEPPGDADE